MFSQLRLISRFALVGLYIYSSRFLKHYFMKPSYLFVAPDLDLEPIRLYGLWAPNRVWSDVSIKALVPAH